MGSRAVSFILIPVYTAYILPSEWGSLSLLMISGDLFVLFSGCQLSSALYKFWDDSKGEQSRKRLTGAVFIVSILFPLLTSIPVFYYANYLASLAGIEGHADYVRILLLTELLAIILSVIQAEMRLRNEAKRYAFYDIFYNFITATINIFLVVALGWSIWGILVGQLIGFLLVVLLVAPRFFRRIIFSYDIDIFKKLYKFSIPLIPAAVAMASVHNIDRYFVQFFQGSSEVGIYAIGYKFGTIVSILVTGPFLLIWEPKSYEIANSPDGANKVGRIFLWYFAISAFVVSGLLCFSKEIITIMAADEYFDAWKVIPLVAISYLFFGMDSIVRIGLLVKSKTNVILNVVIVAFLLNLTFNYYFVPVFGMVGAAMSTIASFALLFILDLYFSSKIFKINWPFSDILKIIIALITVLLISWLSDILIDDFLILIIFKIVAQFAFPAVLFITGVISIKKIKDFKSILFG
jgi:O-antigen/teichoic acid export membrane protein